MSQKAISITVRITSYILCAISAIIFCLSVLGMIFFGESQSKKDILESGYKNIAGNYSAEAMHYFLDGDMEGLAEVFEDIGFRFSIVKMETKEEEAQVMVTNAPQDAVFTFQHRFYSTYPHYNTGNLLGSLYYDEAELQHYTEITNIDNYVFDANKGIFYAETHIGFFEVEYIYVKHNNAIYDYKLQNVNGIRCYYNNYYDLMLDTTKFSEWEWVQIENEYLYEYQIITDSANIEEKLYQGKFSISEDQIYYSITDNTKYMVYSYVEEQTKDNTGLFLEWKTLIDFLYTMEHKLEAIQVSSLMVFVITFVWLIYSTKDTLTFMHKLPIVTYMSVIGCIELGLAVLFMEIVKFVGGYSYLTFRTYVTILLEIAFVIAFIALFFITNITARIKARSFWYYSEFYYLLIPFVWIRKKWIAYYEELQKNSSFIGKASVIIGIINLVEFSVVLYIENRLWYGDFLILYFVLYKLITLPLLIILLLQMKTLQEGAKRVASGNLTEPIDTTKMFWEFKKHGEYINQSGKGISLAVEERMKSERLKTELITNVSHDIKTPLTSIINYVDLIKKENITDETLLEYIEVLDRQSARLKKLIEDLMEASKASTGNLTCNMEECNLDVFLGQLMGEFEEKLNHVGLEVVVTKPEEVIFIQADGRHLWRIMDNLMNNIYKYSLPNSRVYINVEKTEKIVKLIFRNISKSQLNISSDELMERFVRGDSSRNTEGNGLGLSIAQSLVELIGATMQLDIDGDLFKVTLQFVAVEENKEIVLDDEKEKTEPKEKKHIKIPNVFGKKKRENKTSCQKKESDELDFFGDVKEKSEDSTDRESLF